MNLMYLKSFFKNWREKAKTKVAFIFVPDARHKVRKLYVSHFSMVLVLVASTGIVLSLAGGFSYYLTHSHHLKDENHRLTMALAQSEDKVARLDDIYKDQNSTAILIEEKVQEVASAYKRRLNDLEKLETKASHLIAQVNKKENVRLQVPTSRSFDRSRSLWVAENSSSDNLDSSPVMTPWTSNSPEDSLDSLLSLLSENGLSKIINENSAIYENLSKDIEKTYAFLDCRPDLKPASGIITSGFGMRHHPVTGRFAMHKGIDIANKVGSPIWAAGSGVVISSENDGGFGNLIVIDHGYNYKSAYAHNNKNLVKVGDRVKKGQKIALMGATGRTTGPHVHFEIHYKGHHIDPVTVLK